MPKNRLQARCQLFRSVKLAPSDWLRPSAKAPRSASKAALLARNLELFRVGHRSEVSELVVDPVAVGAAERE